MSKLFGSGSYRATRKLVVAAQLRSGSLARSGAFTLRSVKDDWDEAEELLRLAEEEFERELEVELKTNTKKDISS